MSKNGTVFSISLCTCGTAKVFFIGNITQDNLQMTYNIDIIHNIQEETDLIPQQYTFTSYPNPFNSSTTISFAVPAKSEVSIRIFDLSGRIVDSVVENNYNSGFYNVSYDAGVLPAGLYLMQMTASDFRAVERIVILK